MVFGMYHQPPRSDHPPDVSFSASSEEDRREGLSSWLPLPERQQRNIMASANSETSQRNSNMSWMDSSSSTQHEGLVTSPVRHTVLAKNNSVPPAEGGGGERGGMSLAPPPEDIETLDWYHYSISRHVAESVLISTGEDGSYLLRDSTSNPGEFTLSVRARMSVKHFPVRWDGSEFSFGFGRFSTVSELQEHFASNPVIGGESGVLTHLRYPYPRCVEEPETYDQIRVHAEWGAPESSRRHNDATPTFAIASKEGYLTKLGYHRKNWLTRWFVLYKNELSYYKTREEKTPLKTVNMKDVMDVIADDSQGKQNCFRLITPYRTFFLYAGSAQEAEDWIKILRWKLDHPSGTETAQRLGKLQ